MSLPTGPQPVARAASSAGQRKAILVVGASRSGTSLMAHLLHKLGAETGPNLLGSGYGNALGHWEPAALVAMNDAALAEMGLSWDDPRSRPDGWFQSRAAHRLTTILSDKINAQFGTAPLFVLKDPRLTRLLPIYLDALDILDIEPVVVLQCRRPQEAVGSLVARDGFTTAAAELLWLRSIVEAEMDSRLCKRSWVLFDDLAHDLERTLLRLTEKLEISWPTALEERTDSLRCLVKPRFIHQRRQTQDMAQKPLVAEVWGGIVAASQNDDAYAQRIFESASQALDELDYWARAVSDAGERRGFEAGRQAVFQTRSWKLTAPLRALSHWHPGRKNSATAAQPALKGSV